MTGRIPAIVALGLVATVLLSIVGIVLLAIEKVAIPGVLENLPVGALGALAALLARVAGEQAQPVVVQQPADQPVPVDTRDGYAAGQTPASELPPPPASITTPPPASRAARVRRARS